MSFKDKSTELQTAFPQSTEIKGIGEARGAQEYKVKKLKMSLKQFCEICSVKIDVTRICHVKICFKVQNLRFQVNFSLA